MLIPDSALWISGSEYDYGADDAGYYSDHRNQIVVKPFTLDELPRKATLATATLGFQRAWINDQRVTPDELVGTWTNYTRIVYVDTYDVSTLLHKGENTIRIELGNGWYNPAPLRLFGKYNLRERLAEVGTPKALLAIVSDDGQVLVQSDASWFWYEDQLLFNNIYLGEKRDLSLAPSALKPVLCTQNTYQLADSVVEPIRRFATIDASDIREVHYQPKTLPTSQVNKGLLVDFHQMVTGFSSLTLNAHEGDVITVRYAEFCDGDTPVFESNHAGMVGTTIPHAAPDGSDVHIVGGPGAPAAAIETDTIICTEGLNHFESEFSVHSFRYALICGLEREALVAVHATYVHTDLAPAGSFELHDAHYDQMLAAALRTKLNNIHATWEDCARERLGYGGDMVALADSNLLALDCEGLIRKVVRDFRADQTSRGGVPETAPYVGIQSLGTGQGEGPLLWQLAYPYLIYKAYQYYGARDLVRTEWPYVQKLTRYLLSRDPEELSQHCLGDHGSIASHKASDGDWKGGTPDKHFTGWCAQLMFARLATQLALIAADNETYFANKSRELEAQIIERFRHADGSFGEGTQTSWAFAGGLGLCDAQLAGDALAHKMAQEGDVLSCGIFGAAFAWSLLHETDHDDAVERWLRRKGAPSYDNMLTNGSGALAEMFEVSVDSYNHAMFSSYVQWFYQALAGINVARDAVAANHIELRPYFSPYTDEVEASFNGRSGSVFVSWKRQASTLVFTVKATGSLRVDVTLPHDYRLMSHEGSLKGSESAEFAQEVWTIAEHTATIHQ